MRKRTYVQYQVLDVAAIVGPHLLVAAQGHVTEERPVDVGHRHNRPFEHLTN